MARLKNLCPTCGRNVGVKSEARVGSMLIYTYNCKHTYIEKAAFTDVVEPETEVPEVKAQLGSKFCKLCQQGKDVLIKYEHDLGAQYELSCGHVFVEGVYKPEPAVETPKRKLKGPYGLEVDDFGIRPGRRFGSNHKVACEVHKEYLQDGFCPKWDWRSENGNCKFVGIPERFDIRYLDLFPFQREGVQFVEKANFRALIGDEPGLGKSVQAAYLLRIHRDILTPALIVCPPGIVYNWQRHIKNWYCDKHRSHEDIPFINFGGPMIPGQRVYIISNMRLQDPNVQKEIAEMGFQSVIIDESHSFKSDSANRTSALISCLSKIPYRICLSGTSIMNHMVDIFNTLHIIAPHHWPDKKYLFSYCDRDDKGKVICLSNARRESFFYRTGQYIIRRLMKDVLPQLPEMSVNFQPVNVADSKGMVKEYNSLLDELEKLLDERRRDVTKAGLFMQILKLITKLRELVGLMKLRHVAHYAEEFLENTDPEVKLAIGVHHVEVRKMLTLMLEKYNPIVASDESAKVKDERIVKFKLPENRLAILSILGMGEGRDIQFCSNTILAERQWNPAKEEQFFKRFKRIGSENYTDRIVVDVPLATGTIDEFFDALIKVKAEVAKSGMDKDYAADAEFIIELAEIAVQKRLKFVG